jgi:LETM1 and EF-hand domain-containing protein 1, mitochondrial
LFENDLTLDNLSRPQLVGMCRYMNINAFGTDNFLRYTLRNRLNQLKEDDELIQSEGVEALTPAELIHAAASRGIRTSGVPLDRLREELSQWINLHVDRELSGTLLILSKVCACMHVFQAIRAYRTCGFDPLFNRPLLSQEREKGKRDISKA